MNRHENDHLDTGQRPEYRHARALPADGSLPRPGGNAAPDREKQTRDGGGRSPFVTGAVFVADSNSETVQLTQVTAHFIHWINPKNGSTGRMMRRHFLNFFTPTHS